MNKPIEVRFDDITRSSYKFEPMPGFDAWNVVPRVGDYILDARESEYVVTEVVWHGPYSVRLKIKRHIPFI